MARKTATAVVLAMILIVAAFGKLFFEDEPTTAAPPTVAEAVAGDAERIRVTNVVQLQERVDQEVTVYGRVQRTNKSNSGHQFLNFEGTDFTVICRAPDVRNFKDGAPAEIYRHKDVEISGRLEKYREKLQIRLREPKQIRIIEPRTLSNIAGVELKEIRRNHWVSPAGLVYKGHDPAGLTRVEHVERHARDIPDRDGPHGVFDGGPGVAFAIIDEAWKLANKRGLKAKVEGDRSLYVVNMGRRVGYLGGRTGARKQHPPLTRVQIVFETGTRNIVTAFPKER